MNPTDIIFAYKNAIIRVENACYHGYEGEYDPGDDEHFEASVALEKIEKQLLCLVNGIEYNEPETNVPDHMPFESRFPESESII